MAANAAQTISQYLHLFWKSLFNGGEGAALAVTTASARVAIPGISATPPVDMAMLTNIGQNTAYVKVGPSTVAATVACLPVLPGEQVYIPLASYGNAAANSPFVDIAAITAASTTTLVITTGFANRSS